MSDAVILLTEKEKQEVRDFTTRVYVLSTDKPCPCLIIEDDLIMLGLVMDYPNSGNEGDTAYFVECQNDDGFNPTLAFEVLREINWIMEERWNEIDLENAS